MESASGSGTQGGRRLFLDPPGGARRGGRTPQEGCGGRPAADSIIGNRLRDFESRIPTLDHLLEHGTDRRTAFLHDAVLREDSQTLFGGIIPYLPVTAIRRHTRG